MRPSSMVAIFAESSFEPTGGAYASSFMLISNAAVFEKGIGHEKRRTYNGDSVIVDVSFLMELLLKLSVLDLGPVEVIVSVFVRPASCVVVGIAHLTPLGWRLVLLTLSWLNTVRGESG